jgi:transposase
MAGNTADIAVMRKMIKNFSMRFSIGEVCIVSDCTMVSIGDLKDYRADGLSYLVGARLNEKVVREKVKEFLASPASWTKVREKDEKRNKDEIFAREFDLADEKLIVVLDKGTEEYDKDTRKRIIEKLKSKEGKDVKELVTNKGYKRYLEKGNKIKVDIKKIESASLLDGIWVVKTNRNFSTLKEAVEKYKELSIVERCFRELKNYINVSPIYHRTNSRIEGHIYASFLSLVIDFALLKRIKELGIEGVYDELKAELRDLRVEWLIVKDKEVLLRDELNSWQKHLFKSFSIRIPPAILAVR